MAAAALREVSAEMRADAEALLNASSDPVEAVLSWLTAPRDALQGCRLGRLAAEPILEDRALAAPLADFFSQVQDRLAARLVEAQASVRVGRQLDPAGLAAALVAVVQGGYVLARATGDPAALQRAQAAAADLLRAHFLAEVPPPGPAHPETQKNATDQSVEATFSRDARNRHLGVSCHR